MASPETKILQENPEPAADTGEYHGASAIEEYEPIPASFAQDEGAEDPFALNEPALETREHKPEASAPTHESFYPRDDVRQRVLGYIALAPSRVLYGLHGLKSRFGDLAQKWRQTAVTLNRKWYVPDSSVREAVIKDSVSAAAQAKNSGDWMSYQRELLNFADEAEGANDKRPLRSKQSAEHLEQADKLMSTVAPASIERRQLELPTQEDIQQKKQTQLESFLDPAKILDLKKTIAEERGKHPEKMMHEVAQKLLEEYFGAHMSDLEQGKVVPIHIQERVDDMLNLTKKDLEAMIEKPTPKTSTAASQNVIPINSRRVKSQTPQQKHAA